MELAPLELPRSHRLLRKAAWMAVGAGVALVLRTEKGQNMLNNTLDYILPKDSSVLGGVYDSSPGRY